MMASYFPGPMTGPMAPFVDGYQAVLDEHGYAAKTSQQLVSLLGRLSRWLEARGLGPRDLSDAVLQRFLDGLAVEVTWKRRPTLATFGVLLGYLRGLGAVSEPPPEAVSPEGIIRNRFERYLLQERGLSPDTVEGYVRSATKFMDWLAAGSKTLETMNAADVVTFTTDVYQGPVGNNAKHLIIGLRSFLRWVYLEGLSGQALAGAVPSAAAHGSNLPQGLGLKELEALLASCDRGTSTGRRDYAVLVLMSRLGLRSQEVALLACKDVAWRAGEITVQGKGRRREKLPLPRDVGAALADYVSHDRPRTAGNSLFIKVRAPLGGLSSAGVSGIVLAAGRRAGLDGIHAHRLRHTTATQLLRAGGSWAEVGQVLRHRSPASTALYAKVDYAALRKLALPWPGSEQ